MGSWGEKPFENDEALDWFGKIVGECEKVALKKRFTENDYNTIRAAAEVYIKLEFDWDNTVKEAFSQKLKAILLNEDWIKDWVEPSKIRASIRKQIKELN